ncbi:hypothetical protein [Flavivirga sp. 57AJ16]|uniref:hypothetical protein n=1 Tax=Flavivirga sp. 57AJ16 TaxID=3025307 RepID=UPI0023655E18|nr:hypothetical protein [Flavivirga sp. 57AJ16]MDD7886899.1 hypothetical protein [Flavivirga sp. 57AJ16]
MNIKINASSELMENNKQADIMSPQKAFQALQTKEGHSLFFSIGTDNVLYLTREVPGSESGWVKTDLSSCLSEFNGGIKIAVKTFKVGQNIATNNIDIIIAIKGENQDYIYTALNLVNEDVTWASDLIWSIQAYDDKSHPHPKVEVSDIYIAESTNTEYIVVDILKDSRNSNTFVNRYYLDPSKKNTGQVWNEHDLSADLNAYKISSCLGKKSDQLVEGIYTMGQINTLTELIYTPLYNVFNPAIPANPIRLALPTGASAMASVKNNPDGTALFVSGDKALHYFPYNKQEDGDVGQVILENDLFLNVTELHANANNLDIVVWGLNKQGQVFYTKCPIGWETEPTAWSTPIPILTEVTQIASYLNTENSSNVIFAHTDGTNLVKLIQNPTTTMWEQRHITLPTTNVNDVLSFNTYTTHIQVSREDNLVASNQRVDITATSPVSVYINNKFTILSPAVPHQVITDETGTITILQETQEIGGVCYNLQLAGAPDTVSVNPMVKMMNIMESIKSGEDLGNVTVTNADGSTQKLVSSNISAEDKASTAQAIQQFVAASKNVPQDGNVHGRAKTRHAVLMSYNASNFVATDNTIWGMSFNINGSSYHSGEDALSHFGIQKNNQTDKFALRSATVQTDDIGHAIVAEAGDIFKWIKHTLNDVKNFFVQVIDGVANFFITIGEELYTFVLDCYHTIVSAVEFVFNKIKVFVEDLIKWIGFLFKWGDIIRTHNVLKNVFKRGIENSVNQVDDLKEHVNLIFDNLQSRIDSLAGLETITGSLSEKSAAVGSCPGKDDPQSNYGTYHLNNGAAKSTTNTSIINGVTNQLEDLLNTLASAIETEGDIFENAFNTFKTQVINQVDTLPIGEIIKRSIAIIGNILIESVESLVDTALDIIKILMQGVLDILDAKIEIPVLSWLYKKITGNDLSLLDVVCLALAIPATLLYKVFKDEAPFPDNATTSALISASSWSQLQDVLNPSVSNATQARKLAETNITKTQSTDDDLTPLQEGFILALRLTAFCSSFVFIGLNIAKKTAPDSKSVSILHGICFYTTTAPNFAAGLIKSTKQRWDKVMNEVIYGITVIEKLVDVFTYRQNTDPKMKVWANATKFIDCTLGVAGLITSFAPLGYSTTSQSVTGAITTAFWNLNRIASPFAKNPEIFTIKMGLIGYYGMGQSIQCLLMAGGKQADNNSAKSEANLVL